MQFLNFLVMLLAAMNMVATAQYKEGDQFATRFFACAKYSEQMQVEMQAIARKLRNALQESDW